MLNKTMLIGRIGKDAEVRSLESGNKVATLTLATSEKFTNKKGEKTESTEWHSLILWNKLAEIAEKYVKKGDLIYAEGKLTYRSYDDKNGIKKYITEIVVSELKMLGNKTKSESEVETKKSDEPEDLNPEVSITLK
jgi:single-strand DNA-binding protein